MTIKPDDPWYPAVVPSGFYLGDPGVPIRLHLAAEMAKGILAGCGRAWDMSEDTRQDIVLDAEAMADELIARMNHNERTGDGK